jgi:hypothetical protein
MTEEEIGNSFDLMMTIFWKNLRQIWTEMRFLNLF